MILLKQPETYAKVSPLPLILSESEPVRDTVERLSHGLLTVSNVLVNSTDEVSRS